MSTTIQKLTKEETKNYLEQFKVTTQLPPKIIEKLKEQDFYFPADGYSMEKKYKGYYLVVEFCIGDYCVYPCSKNGRWLLEKKQQAKNFMHALLLVAKLEARIDKGEHWTGEED